MAVLEAQRLELAAELATATLTQPRLHPALPDIYRAKMERLHEALEAGVEDHGALEAVRSLIERIELHPLEGRGFEIDLVGDIASMIRLAQVRGTTANGALILGGSGAVMACSRIW